MCATATCSRPGTAGRTSIADGCTRINLPTVHTIYPPVAEAMFALLRLLSFGGHGQHLPLQLAAALGVLAVSWLLARHAQANRLPLWTVALWAWCPVTAIELSNNAHIDWLAVLFGVLALTVARGRPILAGLLIGAGVATKLYPGLLGASHAAPPAGGGDRRPRPRWSCWSTCRTCSPSGRRARLPARLPADRRATATVTSTG